MLRIFVLMSVLFSSAALADAPKVLVIGDSLIATHVISGAAIPNRLNKELGIKVTNKSLTGARVNGIKRQYVKDDWDWVVMNGGGNDLWWGCGCNRCDLMMERLVSQTGDLGRIPALVAQIRQSGAKVVYVGYLRSPGFGSPIEHCRDDGDILESRLQTMADRDKGVIFLSNKDLVPEGDLSFHAVDRIHPSLKGSAAIAKRIAAVMRQNSPKGTFPK